MRLRVKLISILSLLILLICTYISSKENVTITPLKSKVEFTDKHQPGVSVCIPAAYTGRDGEIEGQYRINGNTYGSRSLKECASIHPEKGLIISRDWMASNGFQQHVLVKNGKVRSFKDKRKFRRRALCNDESSPGSLMIIESTKRMTMNEFAEEVAKHTQNAVNLDMGRWGYGWIGHKVLSFWTIFFKHWQTNWIVVK